MRTILIILVILTNQLYSQKCVTDEYNRLLPVVHRSTKQMDSVDLTTPYIIPVVVHIIENDSMKVPIEVLDSDVYYIIECINRDFNLENTDTSTLTDTLKDMPGNMRIRFVLADTTPDGLPTTGITRTKTHIQDFGWSGNPIKFDSLGGKDAWAPRKYFNIWVGSLFPGLLGYSQFPGGPLETDGIVVTSDVFKQEPINYIHYNKGRITAHEIGHSLSLRHPWGNGGACSDNMVSDIPTQNGPNYNCPDTTFSLCQGDTTRDIVKHYMDYCGDTCMVMFTKGQVYNARRSIQQHRMGLAIADTAFPTEIIPNKFVELIYGIDFNIIENSMYFKNPNMIDNLAIYVYDMSGKLTNHYSVGSDQSCRMELINYIPGTYIFTVVRNNERVITKKLIINSSYKLEDKYLLLEHD